MKKLSIIVPAYNEENRIESTLYSYQHFFGPLCSDKVVDYEIVVVLNGCKDDTLGVVKRAAHQFDKIRIINLKEAGKGLAVKAGFADALTRDNDYIGFADADMATQPRYFCELMDSIDHSDGVIASRYMKGAQVYPERPFIKEWGRKIFFHGLIRLLFGMKYKDYQCGAKVFKREVIQKILPYMTVRQWAFDVELLYLCKKFGFKIIEQATVWYDQDESKLRVMSSGMRMLGSLFSVRLKHSPFKF